ncbi:MAG: hypothetical protein IPG87_19865 [Saprospiraceae bacterium]|nr:hypothetical protein [Candidatus Vicinibacter affinis]
MFTPDHHQFNVYEHGVNKARYYFLDAACGSGSFLVKAMCNMIKEAGGNSTKKAKK